eukprot:GILJ01007853.1.p1 GENE.GILJ01007853.1~~GILJ01007853.1.p1  ORF type:complete len:818 (-),score=81.58 GILJ01007853.1:142-2595(-)
MRRLRQHPIRSLGGKFPQNPLAAVIQASTSATAMAQPSMSAVNSMLLAVARNLKKRKTLPANEIEQQELLAATIQQLESPKSTSNFQPTIVSLCDMIPQTWTSLRKDVRTSFKQRLLACITSRFPPTKPVGTSYREWRQWQKRFGSLGTEQQETPAELMQLESLLTVAVTILFEDFKDGDDWPELFEAVSASYPSEVPELLLSAFSNQMLATDTGRISTASWCLVGTRLPLLIEQGLFASNLRCFSIAFCAIPLVAIDAATWQTVPSLVFDTMMSSAAFPSQLGCHRVFLNHSDALFNTYIEATVRTWQNGGMLNLIDYRLLWKDCLARNKDRAAAALSVFGPKLLDALCDIDWSGLICRRKDVVELSCIFAQHIPSEDLEAVVQKCLTELRENDTERTSCSHAAVLAGIFKMAATSTRFSRLLDNDVLESVYALQSARLVTFAEHAAVEKEQHASIVQMYSYRTTTWLDVTSLLCCHLLCLQWREQGLFDWGKFEFLRQRVPRRVKVFKQIGAVLYALNGAHPEASLPTKMDLDLQRLAVTAVDGVAAAARAGHTWPWGMEVVLKRLPENQLVPLIDATVKSLVSVRMSSEPRCGRRQLGGDRAEDLAGEDEWVDQKVQLHKAIYVTNETAYLADLQSKSLASYVYNICKLAPHGISKQTVILLHTELCELLRLLHPNLTYASTKDILKLVGILNCWPAPRVETGRYWTAPSHPHLYPAVQKRAMALFLSAKRYTGEASHCAFGQIPRPTLWNIAEFAFDISPLIDMDGLRRLYVGSESRTVLRLLWRLHSVDKLLKRSRQVAKAISALHKLPNWQ